MNLILGLIAFALIMGVIVTVHEFGHFITAKKFGVYCGEFSIGMGPVIWKKQGKETQYSIRALPIGGFVSMAGEEDDTKKDIEVPFERTINGIKPWKRIIVMGAGIAMNILLAWIIFVAVFMYTGTVQDTTKPIFGAIDKDSIAEKAGFKAGDEVLSLTKENGNMIKITTFEDIREEMNLDPQTFIFTIKRGARTHDIEVTPRLDEATRSYLIGVSTATTYRDIAWYESFSLGTKKTIDNSTLIFKAIGNIFQGKNLDQLSGPVGIYKIVETSFTTDILMYIQLFAILSLNIGIFNAIPIPILDGGRIVITILEKIFNRKINEKLLAIIMYIGVFMLVGLMVYATWNDIIRLF